VYTLKKNIDFMRMSLYSGAGAVAAGWPRPSRGWQIPQEKNSLLPTGLLIAFVLYSSSHPSSD